MLRFLRGGGKRTKTIWWAVAVITIVTFVGGFIFLFGAKLDPNQRRTSNDIGRVDGDAISNVEYQNALADQRAAYVRQFGTDPAERDARMLEVQAWRQLVSQRLMSHEAKSLGLVPHDREVVLTLETAPPTQITQLPAFQTDGKFDATKYSAALRNPNQNWSSVEALIRTQLPVRKLQERLMASIKLSEPELQQAFHMRADRIDATVVQIQPPPDLKVPPPTEAELARTYQDYRGRFSSGLRVQLEVLDVPKKFGPEELKTARDLAVGLVRRVRAGEDFGQLAKDYSEGPGAAAGGEVPRAVTSADLTPDLAASLSTLAIGAVTDPLAEQGRFMIFKLLGRPAVPGSPTPGFRIAQIMIRARSDEATIRTQYEDLARLRGHAAGLGAQGLGRAAVEKGMATFKTSYYDYANPPQQLFNTPEVSDWGLTSKLGQISGVFEDPDQFVIAQVIARHDGGPAPREEIAQQVQQLAEIGARVSVDKPRADTMAADLAKGMSLEAAAKAHGQTAFAAVGMTRAQPDGRLFSVPEVVGALFAAPEGKVVGPLRGVNGWYFGRVNHRMIPAPAVFDTSKAKLTTEILQRRQQSFFTGYMTSLRTRAHIDDNRTSTSQ